MPIELYKFFTGIKKELKASISSHGAAGDKTYWDRSNSLKEAYREDIRFGVDGKEAAAGKDELAEFFALGIKKLEKAVKSGIAKDGIPLTYFVNEPERLSDDGMPRGFRSRALPIFLEGVVHYLKIEKDKDKALKLYKKIRKSSLYDEKLKMYRLNASLEKEPLEIGRSRVFVPGWLENESVWLHMEYKYLLEVLKKGLYKEFFDDFKKALIPFQDPARYGRSILENSSFIASSRFFDHSLHGAGFVARLSGATAEFLNMLLVMNLGEGPFQVEDGRLIFRPSPILKGDLFTKEERPIEFYFEKGKKIVTLKKGSYAFSLFGGTLVIYRNPDGRDTFGERRPSPTHYKIRYRDGREFIISGKVLTEPHSLDLRGGRIESLEITLG